MAKTFNDVVTAYRYSKVQVKAEDGTTWIDIPHLRVLPNISSSPNLTDEPEFRRAKAIQVAGQASNETADFMFNLAAASDSDANLAIVRAAQGKTTGTVTSEGSTQVDFTDINDYRILCVDAPVPSSGTPGWKITLDDCTVAAGGVDLGNLLAGAGTMPITLSYDDFDITAYDYEADGF